MADGSWYDVTVKLVNASGITIVEQHVPNAYTATIISKDIASEVYHITLSTKDGMAATKKTVIAH